MHLEFCQDATLKTNNNRPGRARLFLAALYRRNLLIRRDFKSSEHVVIRRLRTTLSSGFYTFHHFWIVAG